MYYRDPCSNGTALIDKPTKCGKLDNFPMPFISEHEKVAGVVTYYRTTTNSINFPSYGIERCVRYMSLKRYIQSSQGWKRDLEINEESRGALINTECTGRPFLERVLPLNDSKTILSGATGRQLKFSSDRFSILDIVLITTAWISNYICFFV